MLVPEALVALVKPFEGFARVVSWKPVPTAVPYVCPAGFWTIGYGELCKSNHPPITEPMADFRLRTVLLPVYLRYAIELSPGLLNGPEDRLAAIADFVYNLGPARYKASTLRKRVNVGDWERAAYEINKWVYGGGRKLPGLVARRAAEARLLVSPR
jgi:lysozyme